MVRRQAIKNACVFLCTFFFISMVSADTIRFNDGRIVEGDILDETSDTVTVEYYGEPITYSLEDIADINGNPATAQGARNRGTVPTRYQSASTPAFSSNAYEYGSSSGDKIDLQLRLNQGDSYNIRYTAAQEIVQNLGGEVQKIDQNTEFGYVYTVRQKDYDGNAEIEVKYHSIIFKQQGPFGFIDYDSSHPPQKIHPSAMGYDVMAGESFVITVSPSGEILNVRGMDNILDKLLSRMSLPEGVSKDMVKENLRKQFGDEALKESVGNMFAVYPDRPVGIGDSWTKTVYTSIGFPARVDTTYTLESIHDGISKVKVFSDIRSQPDAAPVHMGNMVLRYEVTGRQEGIISLDEQTGWTRDGYMNQKIEGKAVVVSGLDQVPEGTSWPIAIVSNIKFEPFK
ncbi:MAG: hypothetical protein JXD21_05880 [Candidatus Omnitrophica bacterium]|nr:hypothetical protein [Candidatus Omnitrophota bacterium]